MAKGLVPPFEKPSSIAPSLLSPEQRELVKDHHSTMEIDLNMSNRDIENSIGSHDYYPYFPHVVEPFNPTVLPEAILKEFHFTFLIRHPVLSIPSFYRCTIPPLSNTTGWSDFMPDEVSYSPVRRLFDYLYLVGQIGPRICGRARDKRVKFDFETSHVNDCEGVEICVVDADDLLEDQEGVLKLYCLSVGLLYDPSMLIWNTTENQQRAETAFEKWKGFHEEALNSTSLKPRDKVYSFSF
jgi:hypothetical protein